MLDTIKSMYARNIAYIDNEITKLQDSIKGEIAAKKQEKDAGVIRDKFIELDGNLSKLINSLQVEFNTKVQALRQDVDKAKSDFKDEVYKEVEDMANMSIQTDLYDLMAEKQRLEQLINEV